MKAETENQPSKLIPIVAFTSGKGGCGKTTIAVNFANVVSQAGARVLLIDFDLANRGCTGLFFGRAKDTNESVTLTRLLRNDGIMERELLEAKPGVTIIPASSPNESPWEAEGLPLSIFVEQLRPRLLALAGRAGASCIVLDCFCGIDVLTTAAAGVADDTLIVNEPDIVTFSGALTLLKHLERSFAAFERKPRLHFVINRLRSNFTVKELSVLYRDNLEQAINEIVLCHFPYHPRIFDTFGKYPFVSDLLPRSLFIRKLELLTYLLFKGHADHLIKPRPLGWSKRNIRSIYNQSIDRTAVDPQFLISKFTNLPLLMGMWLLPAFVLFRTIRVAPFEAWAILLVLGSALTIILATTLLHGCWLAARLNLALAEFRCRLGFMQKALWIRSQYFVGAIGPFVSSLLMSVSALALLCLLLGWIGYFLDLMFNVGMLQYRNTDIHNRQIQVAIHSPFCTIDLRNETIDGIHFSSLFAQPGHFIIPGEYSDTLILIDGVRFRNCTFQSGLLSDSRFANCTFERCRFGYYRYNTPAYDVDKSLTISGVTWKTVTLVKCVLPPMVNFSESSLTDVRIELERRPSKFEGDADYIGFYQCALADVRVAKFGDGKAVVTTDGTSQNNPGLATGAGVELIDGKTFSQRSKGIYFQSRVKSLEQNWNNAAPSTRLARLSDLIEIYILTNDPVYFQKAITLNKDLLEGATKAKNDQNVGISYLLRLILCVVRSAPQAELSSALIDWSSWLQNNGRLTDWFWDTWETYSGRLSLSTTQARQISLIRDSAQGRLTPELLVKNFTQREDKRIQPPEN